MSVPPTTDSIISYSSHSDVFETMEANLSAGVIFGLLIVLLLCFCGLFGNGLSIFILYQREMRSSASYLLLALTFSDTLILSYTILRTFWKMKLLVYGDEDNFVVAFFFFWNWLSKCGTKYFTVAVSLERYIAICHPFNAQFWLNQSRMKIYAGTVTVFAVLLSSVSYFVYRALDTSKFQFYAVFVLHVVPLTFVVLLNLGIYFGIQKFQNRRKFLTPAESSEVSLAKMLLILVFIYSLCCIFSMIHLILDYCGFIGQNSKSTMSTLGDIFNVFNSSVNFVVYYWMLRKFRDQFGLLVKYWRVKLGKAPANTDEDGEGMEGNTSVAMLSNEREKKPETVL